MSGIYTPVLYILLVFPVDFKAEFWFCFHIQKLNKRINLNRCI